MQAMPGSPRRSHFPRSAQHLGRQGEELPIVRALPRRARGAEPAAALPALHGEAGGRPLVPPPTPRLPGSAARGERLWKPGGSCERDRAPGAAARQVATGGASPESGGGGYRAPAPGSP